MKTLPNTWAELSGDLLEPDQRYFKHIKDSGYQFIGDGRSLLIRGLAILGQVTNDDLIGFFSAVHDYIDDSENDTIYNVARIFHDHSFIEFKQRFCYKFVSKETYELYISNGSFLLSSLQRYRQLEHQGSPAGDRFEGSCCACYSIGSRNLTAQTLSGYDTYIFSTTESLRNREEMSERFGPVILKIEVEPFVKILIRLLGSDFRVGYVEYSDLKIHRSNLSESAVQGFPPYLTPRLARALRRKAWLPSVFAKPSRFSDEREVRFAFKLGKDVDYMRPVASLRLLQHVERVA